MAMMESHGTPYMGIGGPNCQAFSRLSGGIAFAGSHQGSGAAWRVSLRPSKSNACSNSAPAPTGPEPTPRTDGAVDRADDGRLYDVVQTCTQRSKRDDEFGGVAKGRIEKPADAFAQVLGEFFRCPAH
jgi:hypothetical protein